MTRTTLALALLAVSRLALSALHHRSAAHACSASVSDEKLEVRSAVPCTIAPRCRLNETKSRPSARRTASRASFSRRNASPASAARRAARNVERAASGSLANSCASPFAIRSGSGGGDGEDERSRSADALPHAEMATFSLRRRAAQTQRPSCSSACS